MMTPAGLLAILGFSFIMVAISTGMAFVFFRTSSKRDV
ncbi:hypothetical protein JOD17_003906 [Geomicrobium sediminis]|uniref:Uncharacterized protein n=1 Tax=Geomicrobium sediminis TaxID=1347788 RepID=A0ABS2PID0_9BACL|nr:hypothetical protein [Geomicrobium sediminis]